MKIDWKGKVREGGILRAPKNDSNEKKNLTQFVSIQQRCCNNSPLLCFLEWEKFLEPLFIFRIFSSHDWVNLRWSRARKKHFKKWMESRSRSSSFRMIKWKSSHNLHSFEIFFLPFSFWVEFCLIYMGVVMKLKNFFCCCLSSLCFYCSTNEKAKQKNYQTKRCVLSLILYKL